MSSAIVCHASSPSIQPATVNKDSTQTALSAITRSSIWFDDGTLVVQAETTQFKIYGGILAHKSEIFRDALGVPQPPSIERIDGVPLVHIQDKALHVELVFGIIFDEKVYVESCFYLP